MEYPAIPMPIEIRLPECPRGLGSIITSPQSPELIAGVEVEPATVYPDDRGWFLEVGRVGQSLLARFPNPTIQVSASVSYPGTIKAFHYHSKQFDYWVPVQGMLQVALVDLRADSPTFGARNTFYLGTLRPWRLLIPPGVGHGYKVIGTEAAVLVYVTSRYYDPQDEGRIPYNHPGINYDWETQRR